MTPNQSDRHEKTRAQFEQYLRVTTADQAEAMCAHDIEMAYTHARKTKALAVLLHIVFPPAANGYAAGGAAFWTWLCYYIVTWVAAMATFVIAVELPTPASPTAGTGWIYIGVLLMFGVWIGGLISACSAVTEHNTTLRIRLHALFTGRAFANNNHNHNNNNDITP